MNKLSVQSRLKSLLPKNLAVLRRPFQIICFTFWEFPMSVDKRQKEMEMLKARMSSIQRTWAWCLSVVLSLGLAACGGGDNASTKVPREAAEITAVAAMTPLPALL
ncbi:hypothetical protein [Cupriavidus sp. SK-3]|uniref:hypothetical protein n=1 Tax=Cupriavidus sp. SK-3 TaxID=1470558 RepID=UPI001267FC1B|nr:hypothetical protein [Cupriavidus sp. SK-3]